MTKILIYLVGLIVNIVLFEPQSISKLKIKDNFIYYKV